jgi:hypothetical protein
MNEMDQRCQVHYFYMGDGHCTCLDDDMSEDCMRCHRTMLIRDGEEPTEVCDHCAHEMLSEIADVVLNYRPKSKQPTPRKRKKTKRG